MFNKYIRNGQIIKATKKAYNALYKSKGYKPYVEKVEVTVDERKASEVDVEETKKAEIVDDSKIVIEELSNKELRELAKEYNIDVRNKKKKELIEELKEIVGE
jgi:hypothetical protein